MSWRKAAVLGRKKGVFNHINFNLYHYAGNNPVKYTDPAGRLDWYFMEHSNDNIGKRVKKFNSAEFKDNTNCASWAFDLPLNSLTEECVHWESGPDGGYQPGIKGENHYKGVKNENEYITGVVWSLMADGFEIEKCDENSRSDSEKTKIALAVVKFKGGGYSYHFLRQELDGKWTQKGVAELL